MWDYWSTVTWCPTKTFWLYKKREYYILHILYNTRYIIKQNLGWTMVNQTIQRHFSCKFELDHHLTRVRCGVPCRRGVLGGVIEDRVPPAWESKMDIENHRKNLGQLNLFHVRLLYINVDECLWMFFSCCLFQDKKKGKTTIESCSTRICNNGDRLGIFWSKDTVFQDIYPSNCLVEK